MTVLEHAVDQLVQGPVVLAREQVELFAEKHKVLEGGVQVGLEAQLVDLVEVVTVHVSVNAEEPLHDGFDQDRELFRERHPHLGREDCLVVEEALNPLHQRLDVARGAH